MNIPVLALTHNDIHSLDEMDEVSDELLDTLKAIHEPNPDCLMFERKKFVEGRE